MALTFDDGPHPEWTPRVLDALAEEGITATFFLQGDRLVRRPDLAVAAARAGHSLQAHCYEHRSHHDLIAEEIAADLERLLAAIERSDLPAPALWRPPYGDLREPDTDEVAARYGLRLVTWTVESCDWDRGSAPEMLAELLAQDRPATRLEPDSVVLMHDSVGAHTAELVSLLASEVRARGWQLGPVDGSVPTPRRPFKACREVRPAARAGGG